MKRASQLFPAADRKRIADAIAKAEKNTSAEIVAVVATASGRYDRAEDIFGFLTGLLAVTAGWLACPAFDAGSAWETGPSLLGLVAVLVSMLAGFVAGSALASRLPVLRLPFVPKKELEEEVQRAAQAAFMSSRIRRTAGGTGILIFVSLYERRVVVLPDDTILEKLPGMDWGDLCAAIVSGMKDKRPTEALEEAVASCGEILGEVLPRQGDDEDELSNELILID
jgi:putative membrane protein